MSSPDAVTLAFRNVAIRRQNKKFQKLMESFKGKYDDDDDEYDDSIPKASSEYDMLNEELNHNVEYLLCNSIPLPTVTNQEQAAIALFDIAKAKECPNMRAMMQSEPEGYGLDTPESRGRRGPALNKAVLEYYKRHPLPSS